MAGDWIKMRTDLFDDPRVVALSAATCPEGQKERIWRFTCVAKLFLTWCLADAYTTNGVLRGYTEKALDDYVEQPGWSAALARIGWLKITPQALIIPRFREHNGSSAKCRAMNTHRQQKRRSGVSPSCRAESATKARQKRDQRREEKNREENKDTPPKPPSGGSARVCLFREFPHDENFEAFWRAYPRKSKREEARKVWAELDPSASLCQRITKTLAWQRESAEWLRQGGRYVPCPAQWLRDRRWEDERPSCTGGCQPSSRFKDQVPCMDSPNGQSATQRSSG